MLSPTPGSPRSKNLTAYFIFLLFVLAYLLNLGLQPLFLEEPRRTLIAIEMLHNKNLWIPTELGVYYFKKPPFFNWVLVLFAQLPGGFSEFNLRLPTVLSTFGIAGILYVLGRKYISIPFAQVSAWLFLSCGAILFYFSTLAEIDLFYSLITFAAFASLFHFYQQRQFFLLFTTVYLLGAIGTLTKGLPSVVFTGWSVLVYLVVQKDWRRLFSPAHFAGIGLYLLVVGGYLWIYASQAPIGSLLETIWGENSDRTVAGNGFLKTIGHLLTFPLDLLKDLAPGALLLVFALRKDVLSQLKQQPLIHFALLIGLANLLPYWLSPGAKLRYVYMLYPLFFMVLTWFWLQRDTLPGWQDQFFRKIVTGLLAVLSLALLLLPFLPLPVHFAWIPWGAPLFALAFAALSRQAWIRPAFALSALIIGTAIGRLLFDLIVLPLRATDSAALEEKQLAAQIHEIVGPEPLYVWQSERISFTTIVYLDKWREQPVHLTPDFKEYPAYYFGCLEDMDFPYRELLRFEYNDDTFLLFQR